jgi:hypothetical protein
MNIICLDIDDCIFLNTNSWVGELDDNFDLLEINLKRLKKVLDKYNAKIFITSSWYSILTLENNKISYNNPAYGLPGKSYYDSEFKAFELLKKYLDGYVIGLSNGNRVSDIHYLLEDKTNKIVAIDDMDLSRIGSTVRIRQRYMFIRVNGLITNKDLYHIDLYFK